jgi:Na+/melibiose symporter-like transporter
VTGVRVDLVGVLLATSGLMALVAGFAQAESGGWGTVTTIGLLAFGVGALAAFTWTQSRVAAPLLPLRVVLNRRRAACYLAVLSLAAGMFGALFFLTFYLQNVLGYSPIKAGLGFLPLTAGLMIGVRVVSPLIARIAVRRLLVPGILIVAVGLVLLALLRVDSNYFLQALPVFLLVGLGTGFVLVTANSTATVDAGQDTAVAGAMVMTSQQIGASLGTALLSTIAGTAGADYLATHPGAGSLATVHGFSVASLGAAGFLGVAAVSVFLLAGPT